MLFIVTLLQAMLNCLMIGPLKFLAIPYIGNHYRIHLRLFFTAVVFQPSTKQKLLFIAWLSQDHMFSCKNHHSFFVIFRSRPGSKPGILIILPEQFMLIGSLYLGVGRATPGEMRIGALAFYNYWKQLHRGFHRSKLGK